MTLARLLNRPARLQYHTSTYSRVHYSTGIHNINPVHYTHLCVTYLRLNQSKMTTRTQCRLWTSNTPSSIYLRQVHVLMELGDPMQSCVKVCITVTFYRRALRITNRKDNDNDKRQALVIEVKREHYSHKFSEVSRSGVLRVLDWDAVAQEDVYFPCSWTAAGLLARVASPQRLQTSGGFPQLCFGIRNGTLAWIVKPGFYPL